MKDYFLTEEQYCNNIFVPLTLRIRAKNIYWPKMLNGIQHSGMVIS